MKKKLAYVLAALFALSMFAGCGEKETSGYLKDIEVEKYMEFTEEYVGLPIVLPAKAEVTQETVDLVAWNTFTASLTAENGGITDRAVEVGDTVNIDYEGKQDGVAFDGGTAAAQQLVIGSGSFIDGFEDGLVGVNPGETVDLNLTFPETYKNNPDLAGAEVVFTVTVNFIYPTEMNDEAIAAITQGEYTTVDSFVTFCGDYLNAQVDYSYRMEQENAVVTSLESIAKIKKVPDSLVEKYENSIRKSIETQAANRGEDLDTFCITNYYMDSDTYLQYSSEASAKQGMIFQYIANKENLTVSDEELDASLQQYVEENGIESVEALLEQYDKEEFREYFMTNKVIDFVLENAMVTEY